MPCRRRPRSRDSVSCRGSWMADQFHWDRWWSQGRLWRSWASSHLLACWWSWDCPSLVRQSSCWVQRLLGLIRQCMSFWVSYSRWVRRVTGLRASSTWPKFALCWRGVSTGIVGGSCMLSLGCRCCQRTSITCRRIEIPCWSLSRSHLCCCCEWSISSWSQTETLSIWRAVSTLVFSLRYLTVDFSLSYLPETKK